MDDKTKKHIISKVFDDLKHFTPALITIAIVTGLIVFLPQNILTI